MRYMRSAKSPNLELFSDIIYITGREIEGSGYLLFDFIAKPLYEVCVIRIKEEVRRGAQFVSIGIQAVC
jgi:hypothetical protein